MTEKNPICTFLKILVQCVLSFLGPFLRVVPLLMLWVITLSALNLPYYKDFCPSILTSLTLWETKSTDIIYLFLFIKLFIPQGIWAHPRLEAICLESLRLHSPHSCSHSEHNSHHQIIVSVFQRDCQVIWPELATVDAATSPHNSC